MAAIVPDSSFLLVSHFQPPSHALTISREQIVPASWGGKILLGRKLKKLWHRRSTRHEWDNEAWRVHQVRYLLFNYNRRVAWTCPT